MAGHDVGQQTHGERKGLGEDAKQLDDGHQGHWTLHPRGHIGPKDFAPILACATHVDSYERAKGKDKGDGNVASHIDSAREEGDKPHQIAKENEEKGGEQVGRKALVVLAYAGFDDAVVHGDDEHLYGSYKSARSFIGGLATPIPTTDSKDDADEQ